jgi:hypothetical protein
MLVHRVCCEAHSEQVLALCCWLILVHFFGLSELASLNPQSVHLQRLENWVWQSTRALGRFPCTQFKQGLTICQFCRLLSLGEHSSRLLYDLLSLGQACVERSTAVV